MALAITRKFGEAFFVGDNVKITLLRTGDVGRVRVVIDAPRDVVILREEVKRGRSATAAVPRVRDR